MLVEWQSTDDRYIPPANMFRYLSCPLRGDEWKIRGRKTIILDRKNPIVPKLAVDSGCEYYFGLENMYRDSYVTSVRA